MASGGAGLPGGGSVLGGKPAPKPAKPIGKAPGAGRLFGTANPGRPQPKPVGKPAPKPAPARPTGGIQANNPLLNPGQPLQGQSLYQAAQALAQAQTQPGIQQMAQQIAQNQRQTQGAENLTGNYFNQLGQQAKQGLQAEQGIQSGLNQQLQGLGQQEQQQLQGIGQNALQTLQSHIPAGDYGAAGAQALAADIARQQGIAAQQQGAMAAFGAKQGANYSGLAASNLGTFALKGQEGLAKIAEAGQLKNVPLTDKIAQLQQAYGADLTTALGKLRQQEIGNRIAEQGLGIKAQDIQATNARTAATIAAENQRNAASIKAAGQRNAATIAGENARANQQNNPNIIGSPAWQRVQDVQSRNWGNNPNAVGSAAWARTQTAARAKAGGSAGGGAGGGGAGGTKPVTTLENNAAFRALNSIQSAITTWQQQGMKDRSGKVTIPHPTNAQMRQVLGSKYDPNLIAAAFELEGYGYLTPQTASALKAEGYQVQNGWTFRGKPIQTQTQTAAAGAGVAQGVGNALGALGGAF